MESMDSEQKQIFATECGTSVAYLSQIANGHRLAGARTIARIERVSGGVVSHKDLRPDLYAA